MSDAHECRWLPRNSHLVIPALFLTSVHPTSHTQQSVVKARWYSNILMGLMADVPIICCYAKGGLA